MCFGSSKYDDERYTPPRRSNHPGYYYSGPNNYNYNYGYDNAKHRNGWKKRRNYGLVAATAAAGSTAGCGGGGGGC
ncbi:uncharacterized protein CDV56_107916 [Aspergillus thermomutatus]|uniref:Uncharacterized protein n=1 Tax=Aspergillus thermomutatus TaxID=41047 RepID=A0A397H5P1_ASPTH|nr:uncharacterized protein CDV56_107916 [Aspergillus thermomutatus]RHZ58019.1 hypothetical protein CDV56_107916 [Aspergillus thermomutatus]